MGAKLTGGCQCGKIGYEILGTPRRLVVCHCMDCQRQSGSVFGMTLVVTEANFRITRGDPKSFSSLSGTGRAKLGVFLPGLRYPDLPQARTDALTQGSGAEFVL
jgi:hypothetical protein